MTLGLQAAGTDLDSLFALYVSGTKAANTGIEVAGTDISSRYQALAVSGTQRSNVGIEHGGADIAALFAQYGSAPTPSPTPTPAPTCLEESMCLSPSLRAGGVRPGHWLDGVGFNPNNHLIPQEVFGAEHYMANCIRIKTTCGAELIASESTPMPLFEVEAKVLKELKVGDVIFVCDNGKFRWEPIEEYEEVGERVVVLIAMITQCYLAGTDPNKRIASHIPHSMYAMSNVSPLMVAHPMQKPPSPI
jgi:hypothetical protein